MWVKRWPTAFLRQVTRPFLRLRSPRLRSLHFHYEKAGLSVADEPIPWNAEAIVVKALIQWPRGFIPPKSDFQLRTPAHVPRMAVELQVDEEEEMIRAIFHLPPIQDATRAMIYYQDRLLGQGLLPFLAADVFLREVRLRSSSFFAFFGRQGIACQRFPEGQCRGLSVGGILTSATSLLPIVDFQLELEVADRGTGRIQRIALPLTRSQLQGKEACLSVALPSRPRGVGTYFARWILADRLLGHTELDVIPQAAFQQSLSVSEGCFLSQAKGSTAHLRHHLLTCDDTRGLWPCFLIGTKLAGMAGLCLLHIRVQFREPNRRPLLRKQKILVTDRPSLCMVDMRGLADYQQIRAFELLSNGKVLSTLPIRPTPVATFTNEGAFRTAPDCDWTPFTEEELLERLEILMEPGTGTVPSDQVHCSERNGTDPPSAIQMHAQQPQMEDPSGSSRATPFVAEDHHPRLSDQ
ncbi:MAG TPA: hypothetical protein VKU02_22850 [Gemmataceae bacterium]|nr:hypothetical protein [Gemmataceae bacterium]